MSDHALDNNTPLQVVMLRYGVKEILSTNLQETLVSLIMVCRGVMFSELIIPI